MKKNEVYYKVTHDPEGTPILSCRRWKVTTVNRNGTYLRCQEKWWEGERIKIPVGVTAREMGYSRDKAVAHRLAVKSIKEDLDYYLTDESLLEVYTVSELKAIVTNLRGVLTRIGNM